MHHHPVFSVDEIARFEPGRPIADILLVAGMSRSTAYRAMKTGAVCTVTADRIAISLGAHPAEVWGWDAWMASAWDEPVCWCGEPATWSDGCANRTPACSADHAKVARQRVDAARQRATGRRAA